MYLALMIVAAVALVALLMKYGISDLPKFPGDVWNWLMHKKDDVKQVAESVEATAQVAVESNNGDEEAAEEEEESEEPAAMGRSYAAMHNEPAPLGFSPFDMSSASAFDDAYPTMEDPAARYAKNPGPAAPCPSNSQYGYSLNVDHLMPGSWRGPQNCDGALASDDTQWAKYAPSKEAFDRYNTAAGSARLSLNTRSPLARITGVPLLLRSQPPLPLATREVDFNDSDFRQTLVYQSTGQFPGSTHC